MTARYLTNWVLMGGATRPANVSVASRKKKPILEAITLRTSVE